MTGSVARTSAGKSASRRMQLLEELSKFIPIDRIGRCVSNVDPDEVGMPPQNRDSRPASSPRRAEQAS